MKTRWLVCLILMILLQILLLFQPVHTDEAHFLTIARDIRLGFQPYTTLFDNKPPGIYYFLGIFYPWFGQSLWGYRLVYMLLNLGTGIVMVKIISKKASHLATIYLVTLTFFLMALFHGTYALTEPLVVLVTALGWLLIHNLPRNFYFWVLAGIAGGIAFWFKQTAVSFLAFLMFLSLPLTRKKDLTRVVGVLAGFGAVIGMGWLLIGRANLERLAWQAMIQVNVSDYAPHLGLESVLFVVTQVMVLLAGLLWVIWRWRVWLVSKPLVIQALVYGGLTLPWLLYRPYHHYWVLAVPVLLVLAGELFIYGKGEKLIWIHIMFVTIFYSFYALFIGIPQAQEQYQFYAQKQQCDSTSLEFFFEVCDSKKINTQ